jgi:hypothetical protein
VPLSEHEQRLLEQMERALYAEDPKFATSLRGSDPRRRSRRRIAIASVGFALGVVLLMTGLVANVLPVSILGFVAMLFSAIVAISSWRQANGAPDLKVVGGSPPGGGRRRSGPTKRSGRGFMDRMEERWNRRRDERDR